MGAWRLEENRHFFARKLLYMPLLLGLQEREVDLVDLKKSRLPPLTREA